MIIALFALAVAMIVGGLLAAFLGWDIVLVERGWTMVIAGSVFAASGALLLGIAAAVSRLARMQADLAHLHTRLGEASAAAYPPAPDLSRAALAGGLLGGAATAGAAASAPSDPDLPPFPEAGAFEPDPADREAGPAYREETAAEPVAPFEPKVYPEPAREPEGRREADEAAPEVRVPDFLLAGGHRESIDAESEQSELDEVLHAPQSAPGPTIDLAATPAETGPVTATDEDRTGPVGPPDAGEPAATDTRPAPAPDREPEREAAEAEETLAEGPRAEETRPEEARVDEPETATAIIGTYTSGDNRYVMYSDGSIEAETPQGVFHFNSLDELKEFIASGGEGQQGSSAI